MRDADVRTAVKCYLENTHRGDDSTRIVEEMGVWSGTVRIDIAVINGELAGYELKSDRDTLARLPTQVEVYNCVFDKLTLVVGRRHFEKARELVPEWWGITKATEKHGVVELRKCRSASANKSLSPYLVAQLLWKEEAVTVLDNYKLAKGWRSKPIKEIHERLAVELPFGELKENVREFLRNRIRGSGQLMSNKREVSVQQYACPLCAATCPSRGGRIADDFVVAPTIRYTCKSCRSLQSFGMA